MGSKAIELTPAEKALAVRIDFDLAESYNADSWRPIADAMEELMRLLVARGAIAGPRLNFFKDPDYFIGGRGRSRLQMFEKNGTSGVDIFRHPNFVKYLRYFLYAPHLPVNVITSFQD